MKSRIQDDDLRLHAKAPYRQGQSLLSSLTGIVLYPNSMLCEKRT